MATRESNLVKRVREAPINDALLKLIHHELGNGLAVLSGYRHLLQQEISKQAPEAFSPTRDVWLARKEHWLGYLQTMRGREMRLHTLLVQLRELWAGGTEEPLCRNVVRTDRWCYSAKSSSNAFHSILLIPYKRACLLNRFL